MIDQTKYHESLRALYEDVAFAFEQTSKGAMSFTPQLKEKLLNALDKAHKLLLILHTESAN